MNWNSIFNWITILVVFGIGIYIVLWLNNTQHEWMKDPMTYCMKALDEANNDNITCICSGTKQRVGSVIISAKGIKPYQTDLEPSGEQIQDYSWLDTLNFSNG